ncbi:6-phosphogluconolactonase [Cellulomonas hominis]
MPFTSTVLPDADAVGLHVAEQILDRLGRGAAQGRPFLLGCPSGRSGEPTYRALARLVAERHVDLSRLVIVMMDDYVVETDDGHLVRVDPELSYSCLGYAQREIDRPLAAAAAAAGTTGPRDLWAPDPADPAEYDRRIEAAGGIDLFLLASGASDGHIALNQPGTDRSARTHVARLGDATRRDNMGTFPELTRLELVPRLGVTVGVATITDQSHEVVMIVTGEHKRGTYARLATATGYEPDWPATAFAECAHAVLLADAAAAGTAPVAPEVPVPTH